MEIQDRRGAPGPSITPPVCLRTDAMCSRSMSASEGAVGAIERTAAVGYRGGSARLWALRHRLKH